MSNAIVSFEFEGVQVQAVSRNGDAWFVGMEVADALGYADTDQAIRKHCKAAENLKPVELTGLGISAKSPRGLKLIPERDLYRLVMNSQKPTAVAFEEKVVGEILPSIRKTGGYMVAAKEETPEELALRAVTVLQATLERQKEESRLEIERQKALIDAAAPKVAALDRISTADGSYGLTEAAKILQVKPKALIAFMATSQWIYRRNNAKNWLAYQGKIDAGYLWRKIGTYTDQNGEEKTRDTVKVLPKGLAKLAQLVPGAKIDPGLMPMEARPFAKKPEAVS